MSGLALSVLLSLVSAVAYAGGAIVQERVAAAPYGPRYAPVRRPVWWIAVGLNGLGALLHVAALAYGPLSLVQPLGALTIVFALPMAALFVGRRAGATAWRGALMATVGLAGLLSLTGATDTRSLDGVQRLTVTLVTAGGVVCLMAAARAAHRHPVVRSVLLATAAGVAFGMASVFTKTVALDLTHNALGLMLPSMAVIAVLATTGMLLSQASYRGAGLPAPLATVTVVNPVIAAAVGLTMFGETFRYGPTGTALALGCGVVAAGGLILLTTERIGRSAGRRTPDVKAAGSTMWDATRTSEAVVPSAVGAAGATSEHADEEGLVPKAGTTAADRARTALSGCTPTDAPDETAPDEESAARSGAPAAQVPSPASPEREKLPELRKLPAPRNRPGAVDAAECGHLTCGGRSRP